MSLNKVAVTSQRKTLNRYRQIDVPQQYYSLFFVFGFGGMTQMRKIWLIEPHIELDITPRGESKIIWLTIYFKFFPEVKLIIYIIRIRRRGNNKNI